MVSVCVCVCVRGVWYVIVCRLFGWPSRNCWVSSWARKCWQSSSWEWSATTKRCVWCVTSEGVWLVPPPLPPHSATIAYWSSIDINRTKEATWVTHWSNLHTVQGEWVMYECVTCVRCVLQVYRVYSNNQEYEMIRLNDSLSTVPTDTKMVVRLGRALLSGEFRIKLFLLKINDPQVCESVIVWSVCVICDPGAVHEASLREHCTEGHECGRLQRSTYHWGIQTRAGRTTECRQVHSLTHPHTLTPAHPHRFRLRKKTWKSPGTVYLDGQIIEKDIHVFPNFEMFIEPLPGNHTCHTLTLHTLHTPSQGLSQCKRATTCKCTFVIGIHPVTLLILPLRLYSLKPHPHTSRLRCALYNGCGLRSCIII